MQIGAYHFLVIANTYIKTFVSISHRKVINRYDVDKFYDKETMQEFQVKIVGAFEHMLELGKFKETTNEITEKVVG